MGRFVGDARTSPLAFAARTSLPRLVLRSLFPVPCSLFPNFSPDLWTS